MATIKKHTCDLCDLDGTENIEAVGYYMADDELIYDVCEKHSNDCEKEGYKVTRY